MIIEEFRDVLGNEAVSLLQVPLEALYHYTILLVLISQVVVLHLGAQLLHVDIHQVLPQEVRILTHSAYFLQRVGNVLAEVYVEVVLMDV